MILCPMHVLVDSLRYTSALSVALAVVFVVVTAGIAIVKLIDGSICMPPRLLPKIGDQASFWNLFTTIPVLVSAFICHYSSKYHQHNCLFSELLIFFEKKNSNNIWSCHQLMSLLLSSYLIRKSIIFRNYLYILLFIRLARSLSRPFFGVTIFIQCYISHARFYNHYENLGWFKISTLLAPPSSKSV